MKSPRSSKKHVARASLAPQLAAYSATALAALALAPAAHAQIVNITSFNYNGSTTTTPPQLLIESHRKTTVTFLANANGPFSIVFFQSGQKTITPTIGPPIVVSVSGRFSASHHFAANSTSGVKLLKKGSHLAGSGVQDFINGGLILAEKNTGSHFGQFLAAGPDQAITGYVGMRTNKNKVSYYGWLNLRVTTNSQGYPSSVSLVSVPGSTGVFGAYDISTDPNIGNFKAGDVAPVPEPSDAAFGLGLLAFGAAGIRELRKRRKIEA